MKNLLLIIALCSDFCHAQNSNGDALFDTPQVHTINIVFSQSDYWNLLSNNKSYDDANDSSTYIPAQVIIDGTSTDSVGIQFKGNSSYYNYPSNKKPFTLDFNEYVSGQKYDGLKKLNLNNMYQDPAFMREKMFLDFCQEKGINAPRSNYAKLYLNGTYWGLYLMVERIDKTFLNDRFANKDGNLWKGDGTAASCANLKYHGTLQSYYNCYELKTNETLNDWTPLVNLTDQINNTSNLDFRDSVEAVMNTNSFIKAWAAYNLFCDFDSYPYRFTHNYYTYLNDTTSKFEWIVWDVSTAFGLDIPMTIAQIENTSVEYISPLATDRPLANRMLANSTYRDTYLQYICSYANNDFNASNLDPKIDSYYNLIKADVYADPMKMYSDANFDDNINMNITVSGTNYPGLKSFIVNRNSSVINELNTLGYSNCPIIDLGLAQLSVEYNATTYPNPFSNATTIRSNFELSDATFTVYGANGFVVKIIRNINGSEFEFADLELESGMYYGVLSEESQFISKIKMSVQK